MTLKQANIATCTVLAGLTLAVFAAGERDVQIVGGASTVQQALNAGLCDELHIDIMPVLFGEGLRIFENIELDKFELARSKVEETTRTRMGIVLRVIYHKQPVS